MYKKEKKIIFTKKLKVISLFFSICILTLIGLGHLNTLNVNAGNDGWTIGDTGYVKMVSTPTSFGTNNYILGQAFLIQPLPLSPYAVKNGRTKAIKEIDAAVPRYTLGTVAIVPYDMNEYLKRHGFTKLDVIKRPNANSTKVGFYSNDKHMKAVIKMEKDIKSKTTSFKNGVYYDKLKEYLKDNSRDKLANNWKKIVYDNKEQNIDMSEEVWSYITRFNSSSRVYEIPEKIDDYLHINQLGIDPNDMTKASSKDIDELKLRYTDLLMTIYTQCIGSGAASEWESSIKAYINGTSDEKQSKSNIAISSGILARGEMTTSKNKTRMTNIITGAHDFLDMTIATDSEYSLGILSRAETVEDSLKNKGKSNTYYNRLLESIRLSLLMQKKNNEKVERTYLSNSLWGSNIASRIIRQKPIISGTKVSFASGLWGKDEDYIETISLKKSYFGFILVPAYDGPCEPKYTATLNVGSSREEFIGKNRVDVKKDNTIKDSPKLTIKLKNKDWKSWQQLIKANKNFKIQVAFIRSPNDPTLGIKPNTYVTKAKVVTKDDLFDFLQNGAELFNWNDSSLVPVPIREKETKKYNYQATVTIFYSNTTREVTKMSKIEAKTNKATMIYTKRAVSIEDGGGDDTSSSPIYGSYVSEPNAYSELKEGNIYNETFEAMAGVPSTRKLYFASGGSEFMVEVEVLYDKDKSAERTYRSYFKGGVDCEFKKGDTAPNMSLGGQSVSLHGGGTYSKTWTGSVPNLGTSETALHTATSVAIADLSLYESAKTEAIAFANEVNSTTLSYTSASDKQTRSYNNWGAKITSDSKSLPQNVTVTLDCAKKPAVKDAKGKITSPAIPCGNEMATANPGAAGSYSITVTWTVPAHVICGPCCEHVLGSVEDTWTQKSTFDTLKITDVRVWKIDSSYVDGMEEITYDEDSFVKATIKQGDPNIFYNIAPTDTSVGGRLRYSLQQQQHDAVTWFERNANGIEARSNKCDGLSGTLSSYNPIPVSPNRGHANSWAKGILYSNKSYPNKVNYHDVNSGIKSVVSGNGTDSIDKATEEYKRFDTRRKQENTITVISDMLVLQTSSGDQSVVYFDTKQTKKTQENYDDIKVSFQEMWTNNSLSASNWKADDINVGSYNGRYADTLNKYKGTGNGEKISTAFDNDYVKMSMTDELGKARVVNTKNFSSGRDNKSSPSEGQVRMGRPSNLRLFKSNIMQNPINNNKEYFPGQSYVYYREILAHTDKKNYSGAESTHADDITVNDLGDKGYTIKSRYRLEDSIEGNVNSIIVHNPVSAADARIVSAPKELDQRTTIPAGSAESLLKDIANAEVCPLSPSLCEFRELKCEYYYEKVRGSFDFEKITTLEIVDDETPEESSISNPINENSDEVISEDRLVYDRFETNDYGIVTHNASVTTSQERIVVNILGKDSFIELPVSFDAKDVVSINVYFGSSSASTISKLEWVGTHGKSVIETDIKPQSINQTMTFNIGSHEEFRNSGRISKLRFRLDGDNLASGVFIISRIELFREGEIGTEEGIVSGSSDDKSVIRNLIGTREEESSNYKLTSGFAIKESEGSFKGFGTSRFLSVNKGKKLSIPLEELSISYNYNTKLKVESNIYIPYIYSYDNMLFSFNSLGFYIPAGKTYGMFTIGDGVYKKVNYNFVGSTMKLGVVFSLGNINECEVYVNDVKIDNLMNTTSNSEIDEDIIGDNINIGTWEKNEDFSASYYIDNLKIVVMPGTSSHTEACYVTYEPPVYTWSDWNSLNMKGFVSQKHVSLSTTDNYLVGRLTGNDPQITVPVKINSGSVDRVRVHMKIEGNSCSISQLYFANEGKTETTANCVSVPISKKNDWQWVEFNVGTHTNWRGVIGKLRFDLVEYGESTGKIYISQIELMGTGSVESDTIVTTLDTKDNLPTKELNCNEPHHFGRHYDYDNDICWSACGNDNNHKHGVETPVVDSKGSVVNNGSFILLDNFFQVYFPNVGDFRGTDDYGISTTTINRGRGYIDSMNTLEWTREKRVKFSFDVLFKKNGVWEHHNGGEWITIPTKDASGQEINYYDFYCLLSNGEETGTGVEFCVEAINESSSTGGKEDPYLGDEEINADCIFDIYNGNITNKERRASKESYHSAYRMSYVDVVGRIGNFIIEDTEDMRFSNLFKESTPTDNWIVEGVLHEVDTSISKNYLAWFNNDGSFAKDIRGVTVSKETNMFNTYSTQNWMNDAGAKALPLDGDKNIIETLKNEQLKPGYNVLFDISTIGDYRSKVQVVPYFYALNTDTDTLTPIDVYIDMGAKYEPINYFGLMSEYLQEDGTYSKEHYDLKNKLYSYQMNLDWKNEAKRRNYTNEEETITKYMGENAAENVMDSFGNVITSKFLTIPYGEYYTLGTLQMLLAETRARTFIGNSKVNSVNINGSTDTNITGEDSGTSFWNNAQRWHLTLGTPSSVVYVPYRNGKHLDPTDEIVKNGVKCSAYEEIEKGNYVILMTADIKAIGNKYILGYDQGANSGRITVNGKTYTFGDDIPPVIAVYDSDKSASVDIDFIGTH